MSDKMKALFKEMKNLFIVFPVNFFPAIITVPALKYMAAVFTGCFRVLHSISLKIKV
jgi:hypothetical protein